MPLTRRALVAGFVGPTPDAYSTHDPLLPCAGEASVISELSA